MRFNLYSMSTPEATLGYWQFPFVFQGLPGLYTIERPWKENQPFKSCTPGGFYTLEKYSSTKYPDTWAFVSEHVSKEEEPGVARFSCVGHKANWAHDVTGCTGFGMSAKTMPPEGSTITMPALHRSGDAVKVWKELLSQDNENYVTIHRSFGHWQPPIS